MKRRTWAALLLFCCWHTIGWAGNIGFLAYQDDTWSLYQWDLQNPPQKICTNQLLRDWAISPGGEQVAYSCTSGEMFLRTLKDGTDKRISSAGEDWQNPAFLSNEKLIVVKNIFTQDRDESDLILYDLLKGRVIQTLEQTGTEEYPVASRGDSESVAYVSVLKIFPNRIQFAVWLVDPFHGRNRRLTDYAEGDVRPRLMPDGNSLWWLETSAVGTRLHFLSIENGGHATSMVLCSGPCEALPLTRDEVLIAESGGEGTCLRVKDLREKAEKIFRPFEKEVRIREMGMWP